MIRNLTETFRSEKDHWPSWSNSATHQPEMDLMDAPVERKLARTRTWILEVVLHCFVLKDQLQRLYSLSIYMCVYSFFGNGLDIGVNVKVEKNIILFILQELKKKMSCRVPKFELIFNYSSWAAQMGWHFCSFTYIDLFTIEPSLGRRLLPSRGIWQLTITPCLYLNRGRRTPVAWRMMYFDILVI